MESLGSDKVSACRNVRTLLFAEKISSYFKAYSLTLYERFTNDNISERIDSYL